MKQLILWRQQARNALNHRFQSHNCQFQIILILMIMKAEFSLYEFQNKNPPFWNLKTEANSIWFDEVQYFKSKN